MPALFLSLVAAAAASIAPELATEAGVLARTKHHPSDDHVRHIVFRDHVIDTEANPGFTHAHRERIVAARGGDASPEQMLIHFGRPIGAAEVAAFEAETGVTLGAYMPHNTYLTMLTPAQTLAVREHRLVRWLGLFHPALKGAQHVPELSEDAGTTEEIHVALAPTPLTAPARSMAEASAIAERWTDLLISHRIFGAAVASSGDKIAVTLAPVLGRRAPLRAVAELLAEQAESHWIERKPVYVALNKYAAGVTQSDAPLDTPLWDRGLTGAGQIVGIGDSGIDHDSCFFSDPDRPTPISTGTSNAGGIDLAHRKIVNYHVFDGADNQDDRDGHGTHVAGSAAGSTVDPDSPLSGYNGMAPDAKIAFQDIGITGGGLSGIPNDLNANFFPVGYAADNRISSNSWGVPCSIPGRCFADSTGMCAANVYTPNAAETDRFMWEQQDMLVLFAAGNDGAGDCSTAENNGFFSVASPATAKNIIAVGATQNANAAQLELCDFLVSEGQIESADGCKAFFESNSDVYSSHSMAYFSSRGPTRDMRLKPDVSAPGNPVFSARGDGALGTDNCGEGPEGVLLSGGTSMATPIVAGNAALVRQYLTEGWYPNGAPTPADAIEPSGALVKAILLNAGQSMADGAVDLFGRNEFSLLDDSPSLFYGFGRLQLDRTLYFDDAAAAPRLFIKQDAGKREPSLSQGETHEECLAVDASQPLRFTLAWTDPPASPSTGIVLVNDLDLVVERQGSDDAWLGNAGYVTKIGMEGADRRNNVEQVVIDAPVAGVYCARIVANSMGTPTIPQRYALVATGGFDAPTAGDDDDDVVEMTQSAAATIEASASAGATEELIGDGEGQGGLDPEAPNVTEGADSDELIGDDLSAAGSIVPSMAAAVALAALLL